MKLNQRLVFVQVLSEILGRENYKVKAEGTCESEIKGCCKPCWRTWMIPIDIMRISYGAPKGC